MSVEVMPTASRHLLLLKISVFSGIFKRELVVDMQDFVFVARSALKLKQNGIVGNIVRNGSERNAVLEFDSARSAKIAEWLMPMRRSRR